MYLGSLPAYYIIQPRKLGQHQLTARLVYLYNSMCAATQPLSHYCCCCKCFVCGRRFFLSLPTNSFPFGHYFRIYYCSSLISLIFECHFHSFRHCIPCTISLALSNWFNMVSFIHYMWLSARSNQRNSYISKRPCTTNIGT